MAATKNNGWVRFAAANDNLSDVYPNDYRSLSFKYMILSAGTAAGLITFQQEDGVPANLGSVRMALNGPSMLIPGPISFPAGLTVTALPAGSEVILVE